MLRDAAIAQAASNADAQWRARAYQAVLRTAADQPNFTTDDVWERMGEGDRPHEPRAMGAVMRDARRAGVIAPVKGLVRQSEHAACHARPKQVWEATSP